jgi:hypothetical protein
MRRIPANLPKRLILARENSGFTGANRPGGYWRTGP